MRFPEFSGEWEKYRLCDVASIVGRIGFRGYTTNDIVTKGKGAIALSPTNIENNKLTYDKDNTYISFYKYEESPEIMIKQGDVIFVKTGSTVGKVAYVDKLICKTTLNPQVVVLKDIQCDNYLLSVLMSTNKFQNAIRKIIVGGAVPTLSQAAMGDIVVTMPQATEQEKLSKFISLLDDRIATQNKIIEDLKKLKSAIRKKMFSLLKDEYTESFEINQLLDYEQPTAYIVANDEYSTDTSLTPVLTANKGFILGYTDEKFGIYQKGECIIFDDFTMDAKYVSFPFKVKSSAIKILTAKPNVNLRFMFEYLSYWELKSEGHKRHYISEIASLVIELPSKERQSIIASLMTSLNSKLDIEAKTKIRYEEQKRYLLSQMFI